MNGPVYPAALRRTAAAPHCRNTLSVDTIALTFVVMSLPCLAAGVWLTGQRWAGPDALLSEILWSGLKMVAPRLLLLLGVAYLLSRANRYLRKKDSDSGWIITAWFLVLLLPADVSIAPAVAALMFALVFSHFVFGGYGMAPIHPTVAGAVFLMVSFGDPGRSIQIAPDQVGMSTWFTAISGGDVGNVWSLLSGDQVGGLGTMLPLLSLVAALALVVIGTASWRTLVAGVAGVLVATSVIPAPENANPLVSAWYGQLLLGQFLFVLVFIASEPGSQALTVTGRWFAGFAFGFMTVLLRLVDPSHPEGSIPALLLVSVCVPLIDAMVVRSVAWRRLRLRDE